MQIVYLKQLSFVLYRLVGKHTELIYLQSIEYLKHNKNKFMNIHLIAIGGSAMHNLALELHKKGYPGDRFG